jgi:transcriptional antiterminator RfaH
VEGAFYGCCGLYEGMSGPERVAILLELLGRKVRVALDSEIIEAA